MATSFDIPGLRAAQRQAEREDYFVRREVMGPAYKLETSEQHQEGDPMRRPHGVPPDLRPSLVEIIMDAPRALPVPQTIEHGPEESGSEAFNEAEQGQYARAYRGFTQVLSLADMHHHGGLGSETGLSPWVYHDRRRSGRRYRGTWEGDQDIPQKPPAPALAPADMPFERFVRGW